MDGYQARVVGTKGTVVVNDKTWEMTNIRFHVHVGDEDANYSLMADHVSGKICANHLDFALALGAELQLPGLDSLVGWSLPVENLDSGENICLPDMKHFLIATEDARVKVISYQGEFITVELSGHYDAINTDTDDVLPNPLPVSGKLVARAFQSNAS